MMYQVLHGDVGLEMPFLLGYIRLGIFLQAELDGSLYHDR